MITTLAHLVRSSQVHSFNPTKAHSITPLAHSFNRTNVQLIFIPPPRYTPPCQPNVSFRCEHTLDPVRKIQPGELVHGTHNIARDGSCIVCVAVLTQSWRIGEGGGLPLEHVGTEGVLREFVLAIEQGFAQRESWRNEQPQKQLCVF